MDDDKNKALEEKRKSIREFLPFWARELLGMWDETELELWCRGWDLNPRRPAPEDLKSSSIS
jgi:hypothetical protein